jgi:integrase
MKLTDNAIKNAKPTDKRWQLADGKGLVVYIMPNGSKLWHYRYRYGGKASMLALGAYPEVSLSAARMARTEAATLLSQGINPSERRKAVKAAKHGSVANSFEVVAREWFGEHKQSWVTGHADKIIRRLERDIFPWLGKRPIAEITAPNVLAVVRRIKDRGALETAHRALGNCGQVFRYGVQTGRCVRDVTFDLRGALPQPVVKHMAAFTDPKDIARLIRSFDEFKGSFTVQCALRLSVLVFVRPGELRTARWDDIDFERGEWRYFVTKTKTAHIVPLSTQAIEILRELHPLTGSSEYVFSVNHPTQPMSSNTINSALRRLGWDTQNEHTGHGVRPMARTIIAEELGVAPEAIEHQLAHRVPDALGTAYNRTKYLKDRKAMMQIWADYLDKLKAGAQVIPMKRA